MTAIKIALTHEDVRIRSSARTDVVQRYKAAKYCDSFIITSFRFFLWISYL
jgi:hypothetical protein